MKYALVLCALIFLAPVGRAHSFSVTNNRPEWRHNGAVVVATPDEGVWSVATSWSNDWPVDWVHITPTERQTSGEWTILRATAQIKGGELWVRDAYRQLDNGLTHCIRRYEWRGKVPLERVTLSVRLHVSGDRLQSFLPGLLYYGNPNGARVNREVVPVYNGVAGEWAIFEEHRYGQPFAVLENGVQRYAAALHTTPSPVRGAVLSDQWWSMGVEAYDGYSELVLLSGPVGYNHRHSVAKALQNSPMDYNQTYLELEPGRVIEKEFFVSLYPIERSGSGFQTPLYQSIARHQPFDADRFASFDEIVRSKYKFACSRWIEGPVPGFGMYDLSVRKDLVMGWCGQADAPGFALQALEQRLGDPSIPDKVQRSMDALARTPIGPHGLFPVGYSLATEQRYGGDPVSCGQAMGNFARAIGLARRDPRYHTQHWEAFLKQACDSVARWIMARDWDPRSTAEAFYIEPLVHSARLFDEPLYRQAAVKAAELFARRHLADASYWGGTLDATCEDKEGAWAAFQGFLALYEEVGTPQYLDWAKHAMDVCLSYVVVWDIPLPAGRMADYHFKTTGWSVVSPQNQHIDVFGVLFAPEVYRMGVLLGNESLQKLSKVMFRSCFQLTDPFGAQGEQLQQTNFAQHGDRSNVHRLRGGYSESWTVFWITAHFLNAAAKFELMDAAQ